MIGYSIVPQSILPSVEYSILCRLYIDVIHDPWREQKAKELHDAKESAERERERERERKYT